jgi:hypothetical protein
MIFQIRLRRVVTYEEAATAVAVGMVVSNVVKLKEVLKEVVVIEEPRALVVTMIVDRTVGEDEVIVMI